MTKKRKILISVLAAISVSAVAVMAAGCNPVDDIKQKINQFRCEHEWNDGEITKESTCTEKGELTKTCTLCEKVEIVELELENHVVVYVESLAPTCNESGLTDGTKCSVCETKISGFQELPALGHIVNRIPGIEVSCLENGLTYGETCTRCDEVLVEQTVIPATGHNLVVLPALDATCTESGMSTGVSCSLCGTVYNEQVEFPALGHIDDDKNNKCDTCGFSFVLQLDDIEVGTDLTGYKFRLKVSEDEFKQFVFSEEFESNSFIIRFNPDLTNEETMGGCDNHIYNNMDDGIQLLAWYDNFSLFTFMGGWYEEQYFGVTESNPIPAGLGPVIEIETGDWSNYLELHYVG